MEKNATEEMNNFRCFWSSFFLFHFVRSVHSIFILVLTLFSFNIFCFCHSSCYNGRFETHTHNTIAYIYCICNSHFRINVIHLQRAVNHITHFFFFFPRFQCICFHFCLYDESLGLRTRLSHAFAQLRIR